MSTEIVDENGHKLGCPAYRQATFTLCTCGATERAGLASANTSAASSTPRVFGPFEAEAMFQNLEGPGIAELEAERELLLACRSALSTLLRAVEMSTNLRAAIRGAEEALDAARVR